MLLEKMGLLNIVPCETSVKYSNIHLFNNWRAPCNIVLSLPNMVLIFYLEYTHVDIIFHLYEA